MIVADRMTALMPTIMDSALVTVLDPPKITNVTRTRSPEPRRACMTGESLELNKRGPEFTTFIPL